jgi:hypothetical protein
MKILLAAVLVAVLAPPAVADPGPMLRVEFSNPALTPASWSLVLRSDGSAHFHAERGSAPVANTDSMEPAIVDRDVWLTADFTARVFETVRRHNLLRDGRCESHLKVAFQGWKKLSYSGPEGTGGCEFNYSKDKDIQGLGDALVGVASTIVEGARVELLLQHDPLGLDHALEYIQQGARDGRLQQVCAIRPLLEKLESDPAVMERVRRRAQQLLSEAGK